MPDDDPPAPPRPSHLRLVDPDAAELRETLDLLGTLVASMSDRLDGQVAILDKLTKTAAETRTAAFHAKSQMDMRPVAEAIAEVMGRDVRPIADRLRKLQQEIEADRAKTRAAFDDFLHGTSDVLEQRRRQIEGLRTRNWIPITASLVLLTALVTAAATPWVVGNLSGELLCLMADGSWQGGTARCGL